MTQSAEAGWYPDPDDGTLIRYWNGHAWTADTAPHRETDSSVPGGRPNQRAWLPVVATLVVLGCGGCGLVSMLGAAGMADSVGVYAEPAPALPEEPLELTLEGELPPGHEPIGGSAALGLPEVGASGSVHEPAWKSPERQALMDAARIALGTASQFEVLQLQSDGAWAVGEIKPVDSSQTHVVAWRNESAVGWVAFWTGAPGPSGREGIVLADERMPWRVLDALRWSASSGSAKASGDEEQLKREIVATLLAEEGAELAPARVTHFQRSAEAGGWWAVGSFDGPVDGGFFIAMPGRRMPIELFIEGTSGFFEYLPEEIPAPVAEEIRAAGGGIWLQ